MKRVLLVWMVCAAVLLSGSSVALAGDFSVLPEERGDIVQRDGNNVTDEYVEAVRDCQNSLDICLEGADEAPAQESRSFTDGILWGAIGSLAVILLL